MNRLLRWIVPEFPIWALDDDHATLYVWATIIDDSEPFLR